MTIAPASLFSGAVPSAAGILYTAPDVTTVTISRIAATNVSAAGANLTLWVVRSGGTRVAGNIAFGASAVGQTLAAGPSTPTLIDALAGLVLAPGDAIHGLSSVAAALNIIGSGWTQT